MAHRIARFPLRRLHPYTALLVAAPALWACSGTPDDVASNERPPTSSPTPPETGWPPAGSDADAGAPPTADAGGGGDAATPPTVPTPSLTSRAANLTIRELAVFQGVKVRIAKDGAEVDPSDKVHVVAGRRGMLRVYVDPAPDFSPREITARLTLTQTGGTTVSFEVTKLVSGASQEDDLDSTLNIDLPEGAVETDSQYSVELVTDKSQPSGDTNGAIFPASGMLPLRAWDTGPKLRVKLVPVKVNGRLPDTSDEQLKLYREILEAMYPARSVELTVRDVYAYSGSIGVGGSGISSLLGAVTSLRQKDDAPDDVYYYGAFRATDTYKQYCSGGCTTGICHLVSSSTDTFSRACVGVGFSGSSSAGTLAHELGHAHGIRHAPCGGVAGPDSNFPYYGGKIGSWGFDERSGKLLDPADRRDFMSYCSPSWISDYNFDKLIHRMHAVAKASSEQAGAPAEPASEWKLAEVDEHGNLRWQRAITLRRQPEGEPRKVVFEHHGLDIAQETARYYPFSDLPGGSLLIPSRQGNWDAVRVSGLRAGAAVRITRGL